MDHKHDQLYAEVLRRLGVKNPGELLIRDPVQAVAILQDATHLIGPPPVPIYASRVNIGAGGAGAFGTIELRCVVDTYLLAVIIPSGGIAFNMYTLGAPTGLGGFPATAARYTAFSDGRDGQNWVDRGTPGAIGGADILAISVTGSGAVGGPGDQYNFPEPIYVAAGRVVGLQCRLANTGVYIGFMWREVPLRG